MLSNNILITRRKEKKRMLSTIDKNSVKSIDYVNIEEAKSIFRSKGKKGGLIIKLH